ncbi:MAG: TolC family protein, partial [Terriglobales bacterium]
MKWILAWCLLAAPLAAQQAAPLPPAPAAAAAVPLAVLVREAERANPAILAARRAWRAAQQEPSQASALPDPEFEFGAMNVGGPLPLTGEPDQMMGYAGVGVSERFPWPGKLRLRGQMARRQAAMSREALAALRRRIRAAVAGAYYQLGGLRQTLAVLERDRRLLAAVAQIATARYRVGEGNEADVLKAQLQLTRLLAEETVQQRQWDTLQARLTDLLNRPLGSAAIEPTTLGESPPPPPPGQLRAGVAANPALRIRALEAARRQLGVKLARRNFYPDLQVGYMYQATGPGLPYRTNLTVGISLPVFWHRKQDAALAQASAQAAEAQEAFGAETDRLRYQARQWYLQARADERLLHIDRGGLLPQAAAAWRATLAEYESGREDFETVMAAFLDYQNLQEIYWQTLAEHETALAQLRAVTGNWLARRPA